MALKGDLASRYRLPAIGWGSHFCNSGSPPRILALSADGVCGRSMQNTHRDAGPWSAGLPKLLSFDVFGTLIDTHFGTYAAYRSILDDAGGREMELRPFWAYWQQRNIAHYSEPYRSYKEICRLALEETFEHFGLHGADGSLIERYFEAYARLQLYPDVPRALDVLARHHRLAIVSNIDDDLLGVTPIGRHFDLVCTAERARGYKPDGTLFRYLLDHAGVQREEILHSGQSQFTDMVGGKPLGLTIAWINRHGLELHPSVPRPDFVLPEVRSLVPLLYPGRYI
jgi:2-haloacid dehalogenase